MGRISLKINPKISLRINPRISLKINLRTNLRINLKTNQRKNPRKNLRINLPATMKNIKGTMMDLAFLVESCLLSQSLSLDFLFTENAIHVELNLKDFGTDFFSNFLPICNIHTFFEEWLCVIC